MNACLGTGSNGILTRGFSGGREATLFSKIESEYSENTPAGVVEIYWEKSINLLF